MSNECYVRNEASGVVVATGTLQECVREARDRARSGRHGVYRNNRDGWPVCFDVYPDADDQWEQWRHAGLVPRDWA